MKHALLICSSVLSIVNVTGLTGPSDLLPMYVSPHFQPRVDGRLGAEEHNHGPDFRTVRTNSEDSLTDFGRGDTRSGRLLEKESMRSTTTHEGETEEMFSTPYQPPPESGYLMTEKGFQFDMLTSATTTKGAKTNWAGGRVIIEVIYNVSGDERARSVKREFWHPPWCWSTCRTTCETTCPCQNPQCPIHHPLTPTIALGVEREAEVESESKGDKPSGTITEASQEKREVDFKKMFGCQTTCTEQPSRPWTTCCYSKPPTPSTPKRSSTTTLQCDKCCRITGFSFPEDGFEPLKKAPVSMVDPSQYGYDVGERETSSPPLNIPYFLEATFKADLNNSSSCTISCLTPVFSLKQYFVTSIPLIKRSSASSSLRQVIGRPSKRDNLQDRSDPSAFVRKKRTLLWDIVSGRVGRNLHKKAKNKCTTTLTACSTEAVTTLRTTTCVTTKTPTTWYDRRRHLNSYDSNLKRSMSRLL